VVIRRNSLLFMVYSLLLVVIHSVFVVSRIIKVFFL